MPATQDGASLRAAAQSVAASGLTRAAILPVSAAINLLVAHLVLISVGESRYGAVLLIASMPNLLPFADLGLGAPIINEVARARVDSCSRENRLPHVISSSFRTLTFSGMGIGIVAVVLDVVGLWPAILGHTTAVHLGHVNLIATLVLICVAVNVPLGLGARVLIGLGRNHVAIMLNLLLPVSALIVTATFLGLSAPPFLYAIVAPVSSVIGLSASMAVAGRAINLPLCKMLCHCWVRRGRLTVKLAREALPMLVLSLASPLALETDRIVLSHRTGPAALTEYVLAYQMYAPLLGLSYAAATALWPVAAGRRRSGVTNRPLWRLSTALACVSGVGMAILLRLLGPVGLHLLGAHPNSVSSDQLVTFGALLVVQVTLLPSSMMLTSDFGLRLQAGLAAVSSLGNVFVSWLLTPQLGAEGPVLASVIFVGTFQLLPLLAYIARSRSL